MKKRKMLLFLVFLLLVSVSILRAETRGVNLVKCSGAEAEKWPLEGWSVYNGGGGGIKYGVSNQEAHSGEKSVYLTVTGFREKSTNCAIILGESDGYKAEGAFEANPNRRYYFSFWVKGQGIKCPLRIQGMGWTGEGKRTNLVTLVKQGKAIVDSEWKEYSGYTFTTNEISRIILEIGIVGTDKEVEEGGTIWIDDVYLGEEITGGISSDTITDSSVVGLWHLDEGEGSIARDSSGNNNDLYLSGVLWTEGKKGKCLLFDGKSAYAFMVNVSEGLSLSGKEFTISCWIKPEYEYPRTEYIVAYTESSIGPGYWFGLTYGSLVFRSGLGYGSEASKKYWGVGTPKFKEGKIPDKTIQAGVWYEGKLNNRWYHISITYKEGMYCIYVDGKVACKKKEDALNPVSNKNTPFVIGANSGGKNSQFKGLIDEIEILSRAKTGEEIIDEALGIY